MKYAAQYLEQTKSQNPERALYLLDTYYSLMTKLVCLYRACGKTLPARQNVFVRDMRIRGITIADVVAADEYFRIDEAEHQKEICEYRSKQSRLGGLYGANYSTLAL